MVKKSKKGRSLRHRSQEDLEYMASRYIEVFKAAEPGIHPQGHTVTPGKPWDKRRALEVAYLFMNKAIELLEKNPREALAWFNLARGIAMSQGAVPTDTPIPEPTVRHTSKKSS